MVSDKINQDFYKRVEAVLVGYTELDLDDKVVFYKDGEFIDGALTSKDAYIFHKGRGKNEGTWFYAGEVQKSMPCGNGVLESFDTRYEGAFLDNYFHGFGRYSFPDGSYFEGVFKNDHLPSGVYVTKNGRYEGELKDHTMHGLGTHKYANHDAYIGEHVAGKRHGKGKYIFADGTYYEGDFRQGGWCGVGVYRDEKGVMHSGKFEDGKMVGYFVKTNPANCRRLCLYDEKGKEKPFFPTLHIDASGNVGLGYAKRGQFYLEAFDVKKANKLQDRVTRSASCDDVVQFCKEAMENGALQVSAKSKKTKDSGARKKEAGKLGDPDSLVDASAADAGSWFDDGLRTRLL